MTAVHLQTLGCRLNEAELETWARDYRQQGITVTQEPAEADILVVNTCAVTQEAVRKSRNLIRRTQRHNPQAKLVVSGCYSALAKPEETEALGIDLVVGNAEKDRLVELTRQAFAIPTMPQAATEPGVSSLLARGRQRAFIKVQDGCRYRCTYCVVTLARGEERSRPIAEIIAEIQALDGVHEIVLAGVHLGGYGSDLGLTLHDLIQAVLTDTEIPRIRLGSLEPWDIPPAFWDLYQNPRMMPHLHLPIQSGSDTVLRRMARRCKTAEFAELISTAREQIPDINITTDLIVGFPGETADEWQQTLDYVAKIRFGHMHIFSYSARAGTKAASLPNPIDRATKRERSAQLHALTATHKVAMLDNHIGRDYPVLIEGQQTKTAAGTLEWHGYTPNYLRVRAQIATTKNLDNQILTLHTTQVADDGEALHATLATA